MGFAFRLGRFLYIMHSVYCFYIEFSPLSYITPYNFCFYFRMTKDKKVNVSFGNWKYSSKIGWWKHGTNCSRVLLRDDVG